MLRLVFCFFVALLFCCPSPGRGRLGDAGAKRGHNIYLDFTRI